MTTFIDMCLKGRRPPSDIDDFVEEWHEGLWEGGLRETIGLSFNDYLQWVRGEVTIEGILEKLK